MPVSKKNKLPIGQILLGSASIKQENLDEALRIQAEKSGKLGEILVKMKCMTEDDLLRALSSQLDIEYIEKLTAVEIDHDLVLKVPINFAKKYELVPLGKNGNSIRVAIANPMNTFALDDLGILLGMRIKPIISSSKEILDAINRVHEKKSEKAESMMDGLEEESLDSLAHELEEEPEDLLDVTDEAPIIKLVNSLLFQAVKERASDIHIEPFEKELSVRFRVDGVLYEVIKPPKRFQSSVVSRVKIMGGLNIAEKRLPQDGRIRLKIAGKDIDIRLSTVPTAYGERIVMRLLDRSSILLGLEEIGIEGDKLAVIEKLITRANGMLLVTGPTGSGKTTTLYAALSKVNSPEKNIITIEDPIEYQLKGVGQIQVNPKIDLTFANGLRSILRQDPDIIMVGEIRDAETAEIAIHSSLTGHLVLSTLHTNDAPGAITRLVDMGIEPFLVSSSLTAVIAQRLVRIVCNNCKESFKPRPEELKKVGVSALNKYSDMLFYHGKGCPMCLNTGYRGRTGIYELLLMDDQIRSMILKDSDSNVIKKLAVSTGMESLRDDGLRKASEGMTTLEEVVRVTQEEFLD